jgi:hypothetical protein
MTTKLVGPAHSPGALPIGPTAEEWRAMSLDERERFLVKVNEALSDRRRARSDCMMADLEATIEQATATVEQATATADQATAKVEQALSGVRETILTVLDARGIACAEDARARLLSSDDLPTLQRWLVWATTTAAEVFEAPATS